MKHDEVLGLRVFLLGVLRLVAEGYKESYRYVENSLSKGVATGITQKYKSKFDFGISPDGVTRVDEYYKEFVGVAEGKESGYQCFSENGLQLIVALALNDIY